MRLHGNEYGALAADSILHEFRQAARLRSEDKRISAAVFKIAVAVARAGLDKKHSRTGERIDAGVETAVNLDRRKIVVVEAGALQTLVIEPKPERFHQVQCRAGVGAQTNDIAGIRRDLGLEQHDMKHERRSRLPRRGCLGGDSLPGKNDALSRAVEFHSHAPKFVDDAKIDGLLQVEQGIQAGLLHEIRQLE